MSAGSRAQSIFVRLCEWGMRHRRKLLWAGVLLVTGWIPLIKAGLFWHDFRDEVYPAPGVYEAEPGDKLAAMLDGDGPPLVFAHRGDHLFTGQNSLESIERAIHRGYDGVEFDVVNTADDVPVVSHDLTVGPEDNRLFLPETSVDEVREYADGLSKTYGVRYLTVDELLGRVGGEILMVVELKADDESSYGVAGPLCRTLKEHGVEDTVIISSLKYHVIESLEATEACDGIARMYEVSGSAPDPPDDYNSPILGTRHDLLPRFQEQNLDAVRAYSVYTPNHVYQIERAMERGALLIQTDQPGRAMRLRHEFLNGELGE